MTREIAPVQVGFRFRLAQGCETLSTICLYFFALAAPHSIAGSQGGFLAAAFFWLLACALQGKFSWVRLPIDKPLLAFFLWTILSAAFSYEPASSFSGLRQVAFFMVCYFVAIRASQRTRYLALTLILSCLVNVGYTIYQKTIGQGLAIDQMAPDSRLNRVGFLTGDVLIAADGQPLTSLAMLSDLVDKGPPHSKIKIDLRRGELGLVIELPRRRILKVTNLIGSQRFGITVSPGRNFRAQGFYNHYATYAEVLQMITSLAIGFLLCSPRRGSLLAVFGLIVIALMTALIFTATRGPLAAVACASLVMMFMSSGRRKLALILLLIVAMPVGLYAISKWRGVKFIDSQDGSTTWRLEVWQEGLGLIKKHPVFGIGKGSEKTHAAEWGLYRNGTLPPGHFHSTPLQIAVWWGLPALLFFIAFMGLAVYHMARYLKIHPDIDWQQRAVVLGALGAVVGFLTSSFVHFNFGDGEVIMVFWLILGLAMAEITTRPPTLSLESSPATTSTTVT